MNAKMAKPNHFFDMDGTLAVYEWWVYTTDGTYPWYDNIRGTHYYRTAKPQEKVIAFLESLLNACPGHVYILTSMDVPEDVYYTCVADKIMWVRNHIPEFPGKNFHVVKSRHPIDGQMTKAQKAEELLERPLLRTDILYDDFNGNLESWKDAGGTPVKVLNGLNHKRADMKYLDAGQGGIKTDARLFSEPEGRGKTIDNR